MKKILVLVLPILIILSFFIFKEEDNNYLAYMIETDTGEYEEVSSSAWPSGYGLNINKSYCEKGSSLSYQNGDVIISSNTSDVCNFYFDKYIEMQGTAETISKTFYKIEGLVNKEGYRYSGKNINNYICFGSDEEICPTNNLYRIIGIFNNEFKIIKADNILNSDDTNLLLSYNGTNYSTSNINNYLNNTFINNYENKYQNLISNHEYNICNDDEECTNNVSLTMAIIDKKDYVYAGSYKYYNSLNDYNEDAYNTNWLYNKDEWTMNTKDNNACYINGYYSCESTNEQKSIRPVFYLNKNVSIIKGTGKITDPYRI